MTGRMPVFMSVVLGLVLITGCGEGKREIHLKVVNVRASGIYCLFDPSCTVTATDSLTTPIPMSTGGMSFLHSRTFVGKSGTPASGLYGYEYQVDLSKAVETTVDVKGVATKKLSCLEFITIEFGPIVDHLDYNGDGKAGDMLYVVTGDGPGRIGLGSVHKWSDRIIVNFDSLLCAGGPNHQGDSTYFFGLVSARPPRSVAASIKETVRLASESPKLKKELRHDVLARVPQTGTASEPDRPGSL